MRLSLLEVCVCSADFGNSAGVEIAAGSQTQSGLCLSDTRDCLMHSCLGLLQTKSRILIVQPRDYFPLADECTYAYGRGHHLTGIRVIDDQSRRGPSDDEQPVIRLITKIGV